jgi:hypothetical protein
MKRLDGFAGAIAATASVAIAFAIAASGGGCELAVNDALPQYDCLPGVPDPCPSGTMCAASHQCVSIATACGAEGCANGSRCDTGTLHCTDAAADREVADTGFDREPDGTMGSRSEGGPDATEASPMTDSSDLGDSADASDVQADGPAAESGSACRDLTCACRSHSDCDSDICAGELTVSTPLYMANNSTNFCTKPCCTTADCDSSTVCFATGAGGNYCVNPTWIGRTATFGTATGGAACKVDSDCRSGLCAASGVCGDTCCSASTAQPGAQCATGTTCRFGTFPGTSFDTHYTAWCTTATGGTVAGGSACLADSNCMSERCDTRCEAVCRSSTGCPLGEACLYTAGPATTTDIAAGCVPLGGAGAQGSTCKVDGDCQSDFCGDGNLCSDVCFADSDCMPGWHCRPEQIKISGGGSDSVLICGT